MHFYIENEERTLLSSPWPVMKGQREAQMKILKAHLVEIIITALFILWSYFFYAGSTGTAIELAGIPYNNDWSCISGGGRTDYDSLPENIRISKGSDGIILAKTLDDTISYNNAIGFYSSHQFITALLDGEKIYQFQAPEGAKSKTPGNRWNLIPLQKDYAGRQLEIHIQNAYPSDKMWMPDFILGMKSDITIGQIQEKLMALAISMVLLMIGLMLGLTWFSIGKKMHFSEGIQWMGLFSIQFSIWSILETGIPAIMFGREVLFGQLTCISLKLMLLPILCFIQVFFQMEENHIFNLLVRLTILDFSISFVGQLFGWFDYAQTMWGTHILFILTAAVTLFYGVQLLLKKGSKLLADRQKAILNTAGLLLVIGCIIADAWNNIFHSFPDGAVFSRFGFLAFILIQVFHFLKDFAKLIAASQEVETLREEAEMDGLTMMKNRRTFEVALQQIKPEQYAKYSFVLFDLNNLKKMNDAYGHGMGDCYIITASEIMQDIFGEFGEIYRTGGDEFCLVSDCLTREAYEDHEKRMSDWIEHLQGSQVKDFMQIASGYAAFNKSKDVNLQDTIERADGKMYQKKKEQKQERNA